MARNEEKAQNLLNRWITYKQELRSGKQQKRPQFADECTSLKTCEHWRRTFLTEITKKIAVIQNPGLGEHRLRELNDEINKLLRQKFHWEKQIIALGGANYIANAPKAFDIDGKELPNGGGYKYFGAAKDLPGVRELFEPAPKEPPKRKRGEIYKNIDPDYYGFRDEDDGLLLREEPRVETKNRQEAIKQWHADKEAKQRKVEEGYIAKSDDESEADDAIFIDGAVLDGSSFSAVNNENIKAHIPVPDQAEIEKLILAKKKQDLLNKYTSQAMQSEEQQSKELLNKNK